MFNGTERTRLCEDQNTFINGSIKETITVMNGNNLPPLPDGLEPLEHQLAGHKFGHKDNSTLYGMLDCKNGVILKPVIPNVKGDREIYFYELVNGISSANKFFNKRLYDCRVVRQLVNFIPEFLGRTILAEHPDVLYIKMKDATYQFHKPHIIDIKIGAKAWAPDSSTEKMLRQKARCPYLDEIKFQVLGARYFDAETGAEVFKLDLRKYSPDELQNKGLLEIFRGVYKPVRRSLVNNILEKLYEIEQWFTSQKLLSFHGSSILIVFECDQKTLSSIVESSDDNHVTKKVSELVTVKMIDFVHVWETSESDYNYISGIQSLQTYLSAMLDTLDVSTGKIS